MSASLVLTRRGFYQANGNPTVACYASRKSVPGRLSPGYRDSLGACKTPQGVRIRLVATRDLRVEAALLALRLVQHALLLGPSLSISFLPLLLTSREVTWAWALGPAGCQQLHPQRSPRARGPGRVPRGGSTCHLAVISRCCAKGVSYGAICLSLLSSTSLTRGHLAVLR